jgi:hypothetical protein
MADFQVPGSTRLDRFLRTQGIQPWRVPVFVSSGGVQVFRGGSLITLSGPETRLEQNDVVRVVDPPPQSVVTALQATANTAARDYAFVPGSSPFDRRMAGLMDHRPQTIRIDDPLVDSLSGFVRVLGHNPAITAPIRNLVVASHANPEGFLFLKLSMLDPAQVTYEDLEAAVRARSLNVDPALLQPRPQDSAGTAIPAQFLVRGCRIGTTPAYLRKLKEALGNTIPVIAPKHFHIVAQLTRPAGFVEYMGYSFAFTEPAQLRDRPAVLAKFQSHAFPRIDNSTVPARNWDDWVPRNPHQAGEQEIAAPILNPVTGRTESIPGRYRFRSRDLFPTTQSFALQADPGTDVGRKAAVQAELERVHPQYRSAHPFPEYVRFGYATMAEFMNGWTWGFRYDRSSQTMFFTASRAEYTVIRPIVEVATNQLILNFYPSGRAGSVSELLNVTDSRFFASV